MALRQLGDKPLAETVLTEISDAMWDKFEHFQLTPDITTHPQLIHKNLSLVIIASTDRSC